MVGGFVDFEQLHVVAADDRDDDALGTLHRDAIEQRIGDGLFGGFERAVGALALAGAHHRLAHLGHHRADVGKIEIDQARHHHQIGDRADALLQHFVGKLEGLFEGGIRLGDEEQILVGNDDQRIDVALQLLDARLGAAHAARAFEQERLGHHAHGEHALLARDLGDDRGGTGAGAPAHARRDEAHVHAIERALDQGDGFLGGGAANLGAGARAKALRDIGAQLDAMLGDGDIERLRVGVGDDEINTLDFGGNHVGDGVSAGPAHTDHGDARTQLLNSGGTDIDAHCLNSCRARVRTPMPIA